MVYDLTVITPTTAQRWAVARLDDYGSKGSNEKITRSVAIGWIDFVSVFLSQTETICPT